MSYEDVFIVDCATCNIKHTCKMESTTIYLPKPECQVKYLITSYVNVVCSKCQKESRFHPSYHHYTLVRYGPNGEKWMEFRKIYQDNALSDDLKGEAMIATDAKGPLYLCTEEEKQLYKDWQRWFHVCDHGDGDTVTSFSYPAGTVLCGACIKNIDRSNRKSWIH